MPTLSQHLNLSRCPHCGIDSPSLEYFHQYSSKDSSGQSERAWRFYKCKRCGGVVTASAYQLNGETLEIFPNHGEKLSEAIPERAREYLDQALNSINAPAGAIMLCASSIDAMLKEKGYTQGKLYPRIKKATNDGLITEDMSKWAHQVRLEANGERHADESSAISNKDQALQCISFTKMLAHILFVLPAQVTKGIQNTETTS